MAWLHDLVACNPDYEFALDPRMAMEFTQVRANDRYRYVAVSELSQEQLA